LGVAADTPNPQCAVEFLTFVTSAEVQKHLALEVGLLPTPESVYADSEVIVLHTDSMSCAVSTASFTTFIRWKRRLEPIETFLTVVFW